MSENDFKCDCERNMIDGPYREVRPGVFEPDKHLLVRHADACPLNPLNHKELPPLGVNVSDTAGVAGKVGK